MAVKKSMKVSIQHAAEMAVLFQKGNIRGHELVQMFPQYSRATIYRHATRAFGENRVDRRKNNKGRPCILTDHDKRRVMRTIPKLRKTEGSFTAPRVRLEAGLENRCSVRTVQRVLHKEGYAYLQSRKKGLMTAKDLKERLTFCNKVKRKRLGKSFWTHGIAMYIDGKGFQHKTNPMDQARAPKAREWRKRGEGLKLGCTAKGMKEGATNANFMVGISYDSGVVLCEQYFGSMTGAKMAEIIQGSFPEAFIKSADPIGKRVLMDGCPRQNAKISLDAMYAVGGKLFKIPARSPDVNPIENLFHLISRTLKQQAIENNITRETFTEFSARVKSIMENFSISTINNLIGSMDKRVHMILKSNGNRIRY